MQYTVDDRIKFHTKAQRTLENSLMRDLMGFQEKC